MHQISTQNGTEQLSSGGYHRHDAVCPVCGSDDFTFWLKAPDRFHGKRTLYELVRCSACSMVWLKHPPAPDEMKLHYGPAYDHFIAAAKVAPGHWKRPYDILTMYKRGGVLLDLGCGSGSFLATLRNPAWTLFGVEMSAPAAAEAQARTGAQVFVGDIVEAPYLPGTFDVVTCFDVLEHVYEPKKVVAKVREWLKPGGIFFVIVPNIESAEARAFGSYWYALELPRHMSHFSPESLRNVALSAGLEAFSIGTHRVSTLGYSIGYVRGEALRKLGMLREPLARAKRPGLARRATRKLWRLTVESTLFRLISFLGEGEQTLAVFVNGSSGSRH